MNTPIPGDLSPRIAAIYRRTSTSHQDNSLEVQEHISTEYSARLGFSAQDFADDDVSGSIPFAERRGGAELLRRLMLGDVKTIVTAKQDRLGRDTLDTIATIRKIWDLGVTPHFPAEGGAYPRTNQNELLFEIKASVAQYERNLIRERTRTVMQHKRAKGELTGVVPFGFDCLYTFADGTTLLSPMALSTKPDSERYSAEFARRGAVTSKRLVPNPSEQDTLRRISAWRAADWTLQRIANQLNSDGLHSKLGGPWHCSTVDSVLKSTATAALLIKAAA